MKLCLGTVQFGMAYGINNMYGKPSREDVFSMLDYAIAEGIDCIDTAQAYGDAEEILGSYGLGKKRQVKIISKLRPHAVDGKVHPEKVVEAEIENSLQKLQVDHLDGYLLHTPEYIYHEGVREGLERCKQRGLVEHIGVSVYEMSHARDAIASGWIDYIQAPYSLLDQRMTQEGIVEEAKKTGVTVFLRSAFLQGLLMMDANRVPEHVRQAQPMLEKLNEILIKYGWSRVQAALYFSLSAGADYLVFGVDTLEQLKENMYWHRQFSINYEKDDCLMQLRSLFPNIERSIIFPSLWKDKKVEQT